jgi:hypothetical protein
MVHRIISKFRIRGEDFFIHKGDTGTMPLVAPSCALVGKAIVEAKHYNRAKKIYFMLSFKVILIKFKLWLKASIART